MRINNRHLKQMILAEMSHLAGQNEPVEHEEAWEFADTASEEAKKINAETGLDYNTDQAYWDELGVHTGEDLARSVLASVYSDTYKSLSGIRPRWMNFSKMSPKEIQDEINKLEEEMDDDQWGSDEDFARQGELKDIADEELDAERAFIDAENARLDDEAAELQRMKVPELGEDQPKTMGMGRRPLIGPARDVRRGRKISESMIKYITENPIRDDMPTDEDLMGNEEGDPTMDDQFDIPSAMAMEILINFSRTKGPMTRRNAYGLLRAIFEELGGESASKRFKATIEKRDQAARERGSERGFLG